MKVTILLCFLVWWASGTSIACKYHSTGTFLYTTRWQINNISADRLCSRNVTAYDFWVDTYWRKIVIFSIRLDSRSSIYRGDISRRSLGIPKVSLINYCLTLWAVFSMFMLHCYGNWYVPHTLLVYIISEHSCWAAWAIYLYLDSRVYMFDSQNMITINHWPFGNESAYLAARN